MRFDHFEPFELECCSDELAERGVIVDDKDTEFLHALPPRFAFTYLSSEIAPT